MGNHQDQLDRALVPLLDPNRRARLCRLDQERAIPVTALTMIDVRLGGQYCLHFQILRGSKHQSSGEYLEVVPLSRLSMTWRGLGGLKRPIAKATELSFTHPRLHHDETARSQRDRGTSSTVASTT
jgi:uncharacterized protein YndB with AHSA1/START domain